MRIVTALPSLLFAATSAQVYADARHSNATRTLQNGPLCLSLEYYFDYPGNDIANTPGKYEDCCDKCFQLNDCSGFTWTNFNGGTCWLKCSRSGSEWKGANADGSANTISNELNRCDKPVLKDRDFTGDDGGSAPGRFPKSCCAKCMQYRGCRGFAWTDFNGGTCWFKGGRNIVSIAKPGVYSWYF